MDGLPSPPGSASIGKAVVLSGTDREAMAHCRVLLDALRGLVRDVVVTCLGAGGDGLDAADLGTVELDYETLRRSPLHKAAAVWKVARIVEAERPDVVHVVGLRPAALACLAMQLVPVPITLVHLPDLGPLQPRSGGMAWPYRKVAQKLLAALLRKPGSFLLVGGEDDLSDLRALGIDPGPRLAVLGGAGVDPDICPVLPPSPSAIPIAAFVGAVTESNGLRALMQAFERLWARGLRLQLELHGELDGDEALTGEWRKWSLHPGVRCSSGWPVDAREVWRRAEICVWPVHARQGLPRVLLEAAACGRALVVSDVPGGARAFVRNQAEGIVVSAGDGAALGAALERLARDADLRQRMGAAARLRVLQGFTEAHVKETLRGAYLSLLGAGRR